MLECWVNAVLIAACLTFPGTVLILYCGLQAGNYVKDEVWHALIVVTTNASNLHGYAVRSLYRLVQTAGDQVLDILLTFLQCGESYCGGCYIDILLTLWWGLLLCLYCFCIRKFSFELQFGA